MLDLGRLLCECRSLLFYVSTSVQALTAGPVWIRMIADEE